MEDLRAQTGRPGFDMRSISVPIDIVIAVDIVLTERDQVSPLEAQAHPCTPELHTFAHKKTAMLHQLRRQFARGQNPSWRKINSVGCRN